MTALQNIPLRIPDQWSAEWFRQFVIETLSKADARNILGVTVTADGNVFATIDMTASVATELTAHNADPFSHADGFNAHKAEADPHPLYATDADLAAHVVAGDPHPAYATDADLSTHVGATDPHPDLITDLDAASALSLTNTLMVTQTGVNKEATVDQLKAIIFGDDWDDLRFPAQAINPAGAVAPPTVITSLTGYAGGLSFSGSADNVIAGAAQMPHSWKKGTDIKPHIHWTKPTGSANAVTWEFYYRIVGSVGDVVGSWSAAQSASGIIGDPATSNAHLLTYFPAITMTGLLESSIVYWQIHRMGTTDADNNAVVLHEFDIHFQIDKAGTDSEIPS
jgi:hypothetical protein